MTATVLQMSAPGMVMVPRAGAGHNNLPAENNNIATLDERAMLTHLRITKWGVRKIDKNANAELARQHRADETMISFSRLLVSKNALIRVDTAAAEAREHHRKATLPWWDAGDRIMPSENYSHYAEVARADKAEYEAAADEFVADLERHRKEAMVSLGDLYDPNDYPDPEKVRSAFTFAIDIKPLPTSKDFRVVADADAVLAIRQSIDRSVEEAIAEAMRDLWGRLAEVIGHMVEKLRGYVPAQTEEVKDDKGRTRTRTIKKAEGIFRDTLIKNIRDLIEVLPRLNVTNDPDLDRIVGEMRREVCPYEPEMLREDKALRVDVAEKAAKILAEVSEFLA